MHSRGVLKVVKQNLLFVKGETMLVEVVCWLAPPYIVENYFSVLVDKIRPSLILGMGWNLYENMKRLLALVQIVPLQKFGVTGHIGCHSDRWRSFLSKNTRSAGDLVVG